MTAALAGFVDTLELPTERGVSPRAVRTVLKTMAKIANDEGDFRYGLRGSKLATLTDYSLSVVRRAQRYLVDHGYVERVAVGGGRTSTKWRIVVHKLTGRPDSRPNSSATETQLPARRDTAQDRRPRWFPGISGRRPHSKTNHPPRLDEMLNAPVCQHHAPAGLLPNGQPRCPMCRSANASS